MNTIELRLEQPGDYRAVEELTRAAFWNHYAPGCDEHYLAHTMRGADTFIKELDFVAVQDGGIVGNIMYAMSTVMLDEGGELPVLCFGPLSVLPACQGMGIGTRLVEHTKQVAAQLGYAAILIYGDPDYYSRLGFIGAETYQIGTADNMYAVPLQALELQPGALAAAAGRFAESPVYEIDPRAAEQFDQSFSPRPRQEGLPSQARFLTLIGQRKPR